MTYLDGALGLDGGDGGVDILGDDISAVHHAARHVLAVTGVAEGRERKQREKEDKTGGQLLRQQ